MIVYKFLRRFFPGLVNSKMLNTYLRKSGVDVGKNTVFFNAGNVNLDTTRPELLHIGNYCKITSGVVILTHDYSRSVLRRVYGEIINEAKETIIDDNVFIGMNAILLMGTHISENSIVGAGSVCHGYYPPDSIIAGNPAKVIASLDDYYKKRKNLYVNEAKNYYKILKKKRKEKPTITDMGAFFPIYLERERDLLLKYQLRTKLSGDEEEEVVTCFLNSKPIYDGYDEFIKDCEN